jgi:hypothetical protein
MSMASIIIMASSMASMAIIKCNNQKAIMKISKIIIIMASI